MEAGSPRGQGGGDAATQPVLTLEEWHDDTTVLDGFPSLSVRQLAGWCGQLHQRLTGPDGLTWLEWIDQPKRSLLRGNYAKFIGDPAATVAQAHGLRRDKPLTFSDEPTDWTIDHANLTHDERLALFCSISDGLDGRDLTTVAWLNHRNRAHLKRDYLAWAGRLDREETDSSSDIEDSPQPEGEPLTEQDVMPQLQAVLGRPAPTNAEELKELSPAEQNTLFVEMLRMKRSKDGWSALLDDWMQRHKVIGARYRDWYLTSRTENNPHFAGASWSEDQDRQIAEHLDTKSRKNLAATSKEMHQRFDAEPGGRSDSIDRMLRRAVLGLPATDVPVDIAALKSADERTRCLRALRDWRYDPTMETKVATWLQRQGNERTSELFEVFLRTRRPRSNSLPDGSSRALKDLVHEHGRGSRLTGGQADRLKAKNQAIPNLVIKICTKARLTPHVWEHANDPHWNEPTLSNNDKQRILIAICELIIAGTDVTPALPNISRAGRPTCLQMRAALSVFIVGEVESVPHLRTHHQLLDNWRQRTLPRGF